MQNILLVTFGASLGALLRWQLGLWLGTGIAGQSLAWGTLAANLLGALGGGLVLGWALLGLPESARLFWAVGFLGGLTTFSALVMELLPWIQAGHWLQALGIAALHMILGLFACGIGVYLVDLYKKMA